MTTDVMTTAVMTTAVMDSRGVVTDSNKTNPFLRMPSRTMARTATGRWQ
jgi:hypothetical protein